MYIQTNKHNIEPIGPWEMYYSQFVNFKHFVISDI